MKPKTKLKRFLQDVGGIVVVLIVLAFLCWLVMPKSDADGVERTLEAAGYHDIRITGWRWTGCGKEDFYHTGFTATGPTGIETSGVVCGGLLKGNTIRID